jgi:septal ring factor EnvC (AmiA/AmiB activator)
MSEAQSKDIQTRSTGSVPLSKMKQSRNNKAVTRPSGEVKTEVRFMKTKKLSKSIKRIESEMSQIQLQMERIGKDLTTVLQLIEVKSKNQQKSSKK